MAEGLYYGLWVVATALVALYTLATAVAIADGRCRFHQRLSRSKMRKRSGWLVVLPIFAALAGAVLLSAMGWAADPTSGERTLAESPWEPWLFYLSYLTPPIYALPYILRAARLVILYDTGLRVRFQCLAGPL